MIHRYIETPDARPASKNDHLQTFLGNKRVHVSGFWNFCIMKSHCQAFVIAILLLWSTLIGCSQGGGTQPQSKAIPAQEAEELPRFPGCEEMELPTAREKYYCSVQLLMEYLGRSLVYPAEAKAKGLMGEAVVQFVITEEGKVADILLIEDPGDGMGDEAKRLVQLMVDKDIRWRPGYKDGKPVSVKFNLPVNFSLPRDPDTGKIRTE